MLLWLTQFCLQAGWEAFCQFCFSQKIHFSQHILASVWEMLTSGVFGLKVVGGFCLFLVSLKLRAKSLYLFSVWEILAILNVPYLTIFATGKYYVVKTDGEKGD